MKDIINWLIGFEERSCRIYEGACSEFQGDSALSELLFHLKQDERGHAEILKKALRISEGESGESLVSLDESVKEAIEAKFLECEKKAGGGGLSIDGLLDLIIDLEYSEGNEYFSYVINFFREEHPDFAYFTPAIRLHKNRIEKFLETDPRYGIHLRKIRSLPRLLDEKILVVDDDPGIARLVSAILDKEGAVDTAPNGAVAFQKLMERPYAAVVTDLEMPVMNGLEFYRMAVGRLPDLKGRFIFFTGSLKPEHLAFFRDEGIIAISKPSPMKDIRRAVIEMLIKQQP